MKIMPFLLATSLLTFYSSSQAVPIYPLTIPVASGCGATPTDCIVNLDSQIFTLDMAAVQVNRSTGASWLIRYNLFTPSALTQDTSDEITGEPITRVVPYTGNIWLEIPELSGSLNKINIFMEQVNENTSYLPDMFLGMTLTDLKKGSAFHSDSYSNDSITGNLSFLKIGPHTCIECDFDITVNLNGLRYSDSTNEFIVDSLFQRTSGKPLLSINEFDPFHGISGDLTTERIFISAVPIPAAIWLFGSGLALLISISKFKPRLIK